MSRGENNNGKWSNLLGMIRGDFCHFAVGGFFPDNDVHDDFGVTVTYLQDTYTWYVTPKAAQIYFRFTIYTGTQLWHH